MIINDKVQINVSDWMDLCTVHCVITNKRMSVRKVVLLLKQSRCNGIN